jgi:hypothetical protein
VLRVHAIEKGLEGTITKVDTGLATSEATALPIPLEHEQNGSTSVGPVTPPSWLLPTVSRRIPILLVNLVYLLVAHVCLVTLVYKDRSGPTKGLMLTGLNWLHQRPIPTSCKTGTEPNKTNLVRFSPVVDQYRHGLNQLQSQSYLVSTEKPN